MKNKWIYTKRVFVALICAVVFFIGCTPEKETDIQQDNIASEQITGTKPREDIKEEGTASTELITIYAQLFTKHTKGPVTFPHDRHTKEFNIACNECHHIYENGKNIWNEDIKPDKCEVCHYEPTVKNEKSLPPDLQKKNLKLAFHNKCLTCHRKRKAENPVLKAPTTCSGCHKKVE